MMELPIEDRIAELEAAGWKRRNAGSFMNTIGPLWTRLTGDCWTYGLIAEDRHLNPAKIVHGGFLQSLVDHALSTIAWAAVGRRPCITIQTDIQFLSAVTSNEFVVAHGMETHRTSNLMFVRGHLEVDGRKVLAAQSVFKISRQGLGHPSA
jgi:uncharacterized protein (TIGR00369 family)